MIRGIVLAVNTFFLLLGYKFYLRLYGLKKSLEDLKKENVLLKISKRFSFENNLKIIDFFYKNKTFKCLECSLLVKNICTNNEKYEVFIGAIKKNGKSTFHAWVSNEEKVLFGESYDLEKYTVIYKQ
tara:strand:+ start:126 stop:506 length:381 start_codon:yes stop_codon:yes gene_type:complete